MMIQGFKEAQAVEHLLFQVNPSCLEQFVHLDSEIWTSFLSKQDGFISKEVWISQTNPGEVATFAFWESKAHWEAIPIEQLIENEKIFAQAMGSANYALVERKHERNQYYRVCETEI